MSRTIRRKQSRPTYIYDEMHLWEWGYSPIGSKEWQRRKHDYHNDNHSGIYHAPSRYCHALDKSKSAKDKQELIKFLKDPDGYEPLWIPRKKDADWNYF